MHGRTLLFKNLEKIHVIPVGIRLTSGPTMVGADSDTEAGVRIPSESMVVMFMRDDVVRWAGRGERADDREREHAQSLGSGLVDYG